MKEPRVEKITTKPIQIIQLNANRRNPTVHALLNDAAAEDSFDIARVTEPWWGSIGNNTEGPVSAAAAGWTPIIPVRPIPQDKRPRVMAYSRSRPDFTVTLRSDIANDLDIQVLQIEQQPHPTTIVVNIYNDDAKEGERSAAKRIQGLNLPEDIPVIISGDWNLHHPLWSRHATPASGSTEQTVEWLTEQGFTLQNEKGTPTYFAHSGRTYSTIDLTFVNIRALELDVAKRWAVDEEKAYGSDHFALRWELDYGTGELTNVAGIKYNFKMDDEKNWKEAFKNNLTTSREQLDILETKGRLLTPEELDTAADLITSAMQDATEKTVPTRKPSDKARPWWTPELAKANRRIDEQRKAQLEFKKRWGTQSATIKARIKKSQNFFKRLYRAERQNWVTETLENAEAKDIWGFRKWSSGTRSYPSPQSTEVQTNRRQYNTRRNATR